MVFKEERGKIIFKERENCGEGFLVYTLKWWKCEMEMFRKVENISHK